MRELKARGSLLECAETESGTERRDLAKASLAEDGGTVVRDDVDAAELLHEHDYAGGQRSAAVAGDGEEFDESGPAGRDGGFFLEEHVDEEEITRGLESGVAETAERFVRVDVASAADEPTRLFRKVHPRQSGSG